MNVKSDTLSNTLTERPRTRVKQLDVLRAVAILLVFGSHKESYTVWSRAGWVGVDLFFVLSGFLVSGLLFKEYSKLGKINPKRFLIRRGLKIYPAFYVFLLFTLLVKLLFRVPIPRSSILSEGLFLQNYMPGLWAHTWSLAIEEHFYLLLALIFFLTLKRTAKGTNAFRRLPLIAVLIALLILTLRGFTSYYVQPRDLLTHAFPTHLRLDSLLFGVLLSYYDHFHHDAFVAFVARKTWLILSLSCALILPCLFFNQLSFFMSTVGFTLLYLGFGGLLVIALYGEVNLPGPAFKLWKPIESALAYIGFYSYSIYLWHVAIATWGMLFIRRFFHHPIDYRLEFFLYVVASIVCGIVMAWMVEQPVLRLRNRYYPARSEAVAENSSIQSTLPIAIVVGARDVSVNT
jgi:peptidoglycan/LPS O-acetylase OafA/YrhL